MTSPKCLRCWGFGRCGTTRPAASSTSRPIALAELGRPRIDVTVRISGFFRDAFPHVVTMLDDAVALVANLDEPAEAELRARAHATPTSPSTVTGAAPPQGFSARNQAPTARGCCS